MKECTSLFKAVSQINVYHSLQQKMQIMIMIKNNEKIMKNNTSNKY